MISANGLTKRYGGRTAVDDVSFTVRPGVVTGFLGPNGAGKSTTMRLMLGLDHGAGRTTFGGRPYGELLALGTASFFAFGIFSLPAGWLADRWSRRYMMVVFYIGCGLSCAAAAFSPNFIALAAHDTLIGIGLLDRCPPAPQAADHVPVTSRLFSRTRRYAVRSRCSSPARPYGRIPDRGR